MFVQQSVIVANEENPRHGQAGYVVNLDPLEVKFDDGVEAVAEADLKALF
jgi:hypothetical protein